LPSWSWYFLTQILMQNCHSLCFDYCYVSGSVTVYVLIFLFSGSPCFQVSRLISCHVFPKSLCLTQVPCFCSQLHIITNHFPTAFSFQVQSQPLQNPHFPFHAHAKSWFCLIVLFFQSAIVLFVYAS